MDELDLVWTPSICVCVYVCVCVCVCARARAHVCVCVCVGGPRAEVPYLKVDLPTQAKKRNQTMRITLTQGGLRDQMAAITLKGLG